MWIYFLATNLNFIVHVVAGLAFLCASWLYFDTKTKLYSKQSLISLGFFLFGLSYLTSASKIPELFLPSQIIRTAGQVLIIGYLSMQKLQPLPSKNSNLVIPIIITSSLTYISSLLNLIISFFYFRHSTKGLERHLKPLAISFLILSLSEALSGLQLNFSQTSSVFILNFTKTYGYLWLASTLTLTISSLIVIKWTYGYLLKQLKTQVFIILNTIITLVFIFSSALFTGLLIREMSTATLSNLETNAKVLNYALEAKKSQMVSELSLLTTSSTLNDQLLNQNKLDLAKLASEFLLNRNQSSLVILDPNGTVLARGENPQHIGDSYSNSPLLKLTQKSSQPIASITSDVNFSTSLSLQAAAAILHEEKLIGYVLISSPLDYSFIDGLHTATGLDTSIYSQDVLVATSKKTSNTIGSKEIDPEVLNRVLKQGQPYSTEIGQSTQPHLTAYLPIFDHDNIPVGMLSTSLPVSGLIQLASTSLNYIHIFIALSLIFSLYPAYLISKYIERQFT